MEAARRDPSRHWRGGRRADWTDRLPRGRRLAGAACWLVRRSCSRAIPCAAPAIGCGAAPARRSTALAPAVARLVRDGDARVHPLGGEGPRSAPARRRRRRAPTDPKPRGVGDGWAAAGGVMRVHLVDPLGVHALPMTTRLLAALARARALTWSFHHESRFAYGEVPAPDGYRHGVSSSTGDAARRGRVTRCAGLSEARRPRARYVALPLRRGGRRGRALPVADRAGARPAPAAAPSAGAHRPRSAPPRAASRPGPRPAGGCCERMDAVVVPRRIRPTPSSSVELGARPPSEVHVIHHGAFEHFTRRAAPAALPRRDSPTTGAPWRCPSGSLRPLQAAWLGHAAGCVGRGARDTRRPSCRIVGRPMMDLCPCAHSLPGATGPSLGSSARARSCRR